MVIRILKSTYVDEGVDSHELLKEGKGACENCAPPDASEVKPLRNFQLDTTHAWMSLLLDSVVDGDLGENAMVLGLHPVIASGKSTQLGNAC